MIHCEVCEHPSGDGEGLCAVPGGLMCRQRVREQRDLSRAALKAEREKVEDARGALSLVAAVVGDDGRGPPQAIVDRVCLTLRTLDREVETLRETNRTQALELLRISKAVGARPSPSLSADVREVVIERDRLREANERQRKTIVAIADAVGLPEHDRNLDRVESTVRRLESERVLAVGDRDRLRDALLAIAFAVGAGPDAVAEQVVRIVRSRLERAESEVRRIVAVVENEQFKRHTIKVGDLLSHGKAQGYRWAIDEVLRQIRNGAECEGDPYPVDEETIVHWESNGGPMMRSLAWLLRRAAR